MRVKNCFNFFGLPILVIMMLLSAHQSLAQSVFIKRVPVVSYRIIKTCNPNEIQVAFSGMSIRDEREDYESGKHSKEWKAILPVAGVGEIKVLEGNGVSIKLRPTFDLVEVGEAVASAIGRQKNWSVRNEEPGKYFEEECPGPLTQLVPAENNNQSSAGQQPDKSTSSQSDPPPISTSVVRFNVDLVPGDGMKSKNTFEKRPYVDDVQKFLETVYDASNRPLLILNPTDTRGVYGPGTVTAVNRYRQMVGLGPGAWTADVRALANVNAHMKK